MHLKADYKPA